mgnify:CR=1 FL=1
MPKASDIKKNAAENFLNVKSVEPNCFHRVEITTPAVATGPNGIGQFHQFSSFPPIVVKMQC